MVTRKGARLSVQPVTKAEFDIVAQAWPPEADRNRQPSISPSFPISARFSISCGATATSSPSTRRSTRTRKPPRSTGASSPPAARRCSSRTSAAARFPLVTNLFGTARRAELAFGTRPLALIKRLVELAETLLPPTPAKLWGARDVGRAALRHRPEARRARPGPRRRRAARARSPAGPHVLARGRRPVRDAAARLHRASRRQGPQPRDVPAAGVRPGRRRACTGRSARAAAFTTRPRRRRASRLPVTVFLGGPPALILSAIAPLPENVPELMLASLIAGERLRMTTAAGRASASAGRQRRVRADGRGARRASGGPRGHSAITTATTRCATTTRSFTSARSPGAGTRSIRPPSSASRGRRTSSSATCCRSCCRRCSRW